MYQREREIDRDPDQCRDGKSGQKKGMHVVVEVKICDLIKSWSDPLRDCSHVAVVDSPRDSLSLGFIISI